MKPVRLCAVSSGTLLTPASRSLTWEAPVPAGGFSCGVEPGSLHRVDSWTHSCSLHRPWCALLSVPEGGATLSSMNTILGGGNGVPAFGDVTGFCADVWAT